MSQLILVPVPVGNKSDITLRALEVLQKADVILCEDTRSTSHLLGLLGIAGKKLLAYHQNNEHKVIPQLIRQIESSQCVALVSDAGTPAISDPGFMLVRACIDHHIKVEALPGPTAFVPALAASGLPCDRFFFEGFLPLKKGRQKQLQWLAALPVTVVIYEAPHRLLKFLDELEVYFGPERRICVCRELSKLHEEFVRGNITEIKKDFSSRDAVKGEFVVLIQGLSRTE